MVGIFLAIIASLLFVVWVVRTVGFFISWRRKQKQAVKEMMAEDVNDPVPVSVGASVIDKQIKKCYLGRGKGFEYQYVITFLTDADDDMEYQVSQETFARLEIDQTGTLVTVNGSFFDFGDGEDIS